MSAELRPLPSGPRASAGECGVCGTAADRRYGGMGRYLACCVECWDPQEGDFVITVDHRPSGYPRTARVRHRRSGVEGASSASSQREAKDQALAQARAALEDRCRGMAP